MKKTNKTSGKRLSNERAELGIAAPASAEAITPERVAMSVKMKFSAIRRLTSDLLATQLDQYQRGYLSPIMRTWESIERRDDRISAVAPRAKAALGRYGYEIIVSDDSAAAGQHKAALDYFYGNLSVTDTYDENKCGGFSSLVRGMADAIGYKYGIHEILWQPSFSGLTAEFRKAPSWFFENLTGRLKFLTQDFNYEGVEMAPNQWLVHVADAAIDEPGSIAFLFKHASVKDRMNFSEKFGMPGILGKTSASQGSPQWNAMKTAVASFANDFAAVCGTGDLIELIKTDGAKGSTPFAEIVNDMNMALSILWRGADLGTQSHQGGGHGQGASVQAEETDNLDEDRAMAIEETLKQKLDRAIIAWTFGSEVKPLAHVHLKTKPRRNLAFDLATIEALAPMGVPFEVVTVLERFGWPAPKAGADLLTPPAAPEPPVPGEQNALQNERQLANSKDPANLGAFLATARHGMAEAVNADLQPLRSALASVLHADDPDLKAKLLHLKKDLPGLAKLINERPRAASELEKILGASLASGLAEKRPTAK